MTNFHDIDPSTQDGIDVLFDNLFQIAATSPSVDRVQLTEIKFVTKKQQ